MLRQLHSLPGLIAALLLTVLALSGAILAVDPTLDRVGANLPADGQLSAAALADRVVRYYVGVEQIQRTASGSIIVYYSKDGQAHAEYVDPFSGQALSSYTPSAFSRWIKNLHRSLLMGTVGRAVIGLSALAMLVLCISGVILLAKRQGGWQQILRPLRGSLGQRLHARLGRIAVSGLLLSALTGVYLSAATFSLISDGTQNEPGFPTVAATGASLPVGSLRALLAVDANDLRELVYPLPGNPENFYSLRTAQGDGYVDAVSGALLSYQAHGGAQKLYELVYRLHTGEGLWWLGLLLGLCALSVPLMSVTGSLVWLQRRCSMPHIANNGSAHAAETLILVGSETNTTWGFAQALHEALNQAGQRVHTSAMNEVAKDCQHAQRVFILTSTYGDGAAPRSADQFLARIDKMGRAWRPDFAVLGFGDRQFPKFCGFAKDTHGALLARGWNPALEFETIDRQSAQEFARWGLAAGRLFGRDLDLVHTPKSPPTRAFELRRRVDYGEKVQTPTTILRFAPIAPKNAAGQVWRSIGVGGLPRFEAGDLMGIVPDGSPTPRFYSLASGTNDGFLEICVRKQPNGLCSEMLHALKPGDRVNAFIKPHPDFRPATGKSAIILIGAGTGIGPLAGFIRNNTGRRPMYLYWGGRDPASDFLYEPELQEYLSDRRLTQLNTAFSRTDQPAYVQDRVIGDAAQMRQLIESGAQILVCGGRSMAASIMVAVNQILAPLGLDVQTLKLQERYREDVF